MFKYLSLWGAFLIQATTPKTKVQMHRQNIVNLCDEYYLIIKRNEILMYSMTWMSLDKAW